MCQILLGRCVMGSCCFLVKDEWSAVWKNRGSTSFCFHFEGKFCPLIFFPRKGLSGTLEREKVLGNVSPARKGGFSKILY